eukprot:3243827-Pleurochrysis_carterae.AAC.1
MLQLSNYASGPQTKLKAKRSSERANTRKAREQVQRSKLESQHAVEPASDLASKQDNKCQRNEHARDSTS